MSAIRCSRCSWSAWCSARGSWRCASARPTPPWGAAPFEPRPVATSFLFVGIDGLDSALLDEVGAEATPGFADAFARGARFPLRPSAAGEPPETWTTILTGTAPESHRVRSAGSERLPGVATPLGAGGRPLASALRFLLPTRTVPASGSVRRVRNLPEIIGLRRPTVSVGWWATWPAAEPESGGFVISDRVLAKLLSAAPADRDTAPGSLFHRLSNDFESTRATLRLEFEDRFGAFVAGPAERLLWESFLIDGWAWRVAARLEGSDAEDGFVYLPGLDILRHRLTAEGLPQTMTDDAVAGYVGWLDERVAAALVETDRSLALVADAGRQGSGAGFVALVDPAIPAGCVGPEWGPVDVAPAVLGLRGFPGKRRNARKPRDDLSGRDRPGGDRRLRPPTGPAGPQR